MPAGKLLQQVLPRPHHLDAAAAERRPGRVSEERGRPAVRPETVDAVCQGRDGLPDVGCRAAPRGAQGASASRSSLFLLLFAGLLYFTKKRIWARVGRRVIGCTRRRRPGDGACSAEALSRSLPDASGRPRASCFRIIYAPAGIRWRDDALRRKPGQDSLRASSVRESAGDRAGLTGHGRTPTLRLSRRSHDQGGVSASSAVRASTTCRGSRTCARSASHRPGASRPTCCASGASAGPTVVFLPRHGRGHRLSPSDINYRANIDAMKRAGVTDLVSRLGLRLVQGRALSRASSCSSTSSSTARTGARARSSATGCVAHVLDGAPGRAAAAAAHRRGGGGRGHRVPPRRHLCLHGGAAILDLRRIASPTRASATT